MRISDHWIRHTVTTYYKSLSDQFSQAMEYQNTIPNSKHVLIRICVRQNGNITATVTPRTHAVLSQLIELFSDEEQVYWFLTPGSATLRGEMNNQEEFCRLFDMLTRFDDTLLPIQDDVQAMIAEHQETTEKAGDRRPRGFSM